MRKIIFILAFIWWTGTIFLLWQGTRAASPALLPELDIIVIGELEKQDWYSVYWRGEKIGYSSKAIQRTGGKLIITDVSYLRLPVGGLVQEIYTQSLTTVDSTFAIHNFSFDLQSGEYNATAEGRITDGVLTVVLSTKESMDTMQVKLDGAIYPPSLLPEMFIAAKERGEELLEIPTFDPFTISRVPYEINSARRKRKNADGKMQEVWVLNVSAKGLGSEMWVSDDGELLYENTHNEFMQYKESQSDALKFDLSRSGNVDMLTGFAVSSQWTVDVSPRQAEYAVFELHDFPYEILEIDDFNQKLSGNTLFVCSAGFSDGETPVPGDTAEVPFIQCHDRRILKFAQKIIGETTDSLKMLEQINSYLFDNIEKEYQTAIPSVLDVLSKMKGDCNEHSTLFVALARALGIPSRIDVGLVYREDGFFLYHAWVQAYVAGGWHTFDPTFGQFPADAAHIKLLSGSLEKQVQLLRIGTVKISVIDAGVKCPL